MRPGDVTDAGWGLPTSLFVGGQWWMVNADFRDIIDILVQLEDEADTTAGVYLALALFYCDFDAMPPALYGDAWEELCAFLRCGTREPEGTGTGLRGQRPVKLIDWRQDAPLIAAEVNRVAGREIRGEAFVHWHTFMGWFNAIGDGQLSAIVGIRAKRARGKRLEDWEQEFYRGNRALVDFVRPGDASAEREKRRLLERLR